MLGEKCARVDLFPVSCLFSDHNTHDGWSRSLRTAPPNDSDSDMSHASRRSQRLDRPPIRKGRRNHWLFSESDSSDSP